MGTLCHGKGITSYYFYYMKIDRIILWNSNISLFEANKFIFFYKLAEINEKNTIIPATSYSAGTTLTSSEDDDSDFREIQFQSESLQQVSCQSIVLLWLLSSSLSKLFGGCYFYRFTYHCQFTDIFWLSDATNVGQLYRFIWI